MRLRIEWYPKKITRGRCVRKLAGECTMGGEVGERGQKNAEEEGAR